MNKRFLLVAIFFLSFVAVSAGTEPAVKSFSEDAGSPEKVALLRARANEFWSAFVKQDYEKVFEIYDPFFRAKTDKYYFFGTLGKIRYHECEIQDVKVEGNLGTVKVKATYSVPIAKVKTQEFSVPKTTTEFSEKWLYIYDNWYKEYFLETLGAGVATY
jgi:uncharacterized protein YchJ